MEVSSRYFVDDLESALDLDHGVHFKTEMDTLLLTRLSDYLDEHFSIQTDDQVLYFDLLGYELEEDLLWVYMESQECPLFNEVEIKASQLTEVHAEQRNIINYNHGEQVKTVHLFREKETDAFRID